MWVFVPMNGTPESPIKLEAKEVEQIYEFRTDDLEVCKPKLREYRKWWGPFLLKRPYRIHVDALGNFDVEGGFIE